MQRFSFPGRTAVITGAASGIGAALARALADRGCHVVLVDRDGERLAEVATAIGRAKPDVSVTTRLVDLADAAATRRLADELARDVPRLDLLVNNAGVALAGRFDQVTLDEFDWVLDINFHAVVRLTHALLPSLRAAPGSHLVNVSSLFGLIAPPGQAAYAASKFAVRGFTEVLRHELADDGIGVTCVHPGGIRTRIAQAARVGSAVPKDEYEAGRARFDRLLTIDPARAAEAILAGVERRRPRVLIGSSAHLLDALARLLPATHGRLVAARARAEAARARADAARARLD